MNRMLRMIGWGIMLFHGVLAAQNSTGSVPKAYFVSADGIEYREVTARDLESAVEISFLGNCGFFISGGGRNILFDAPQRQSNYPNSATPEDAFQKMIERTKPFERIDLMLFSHDHPDHITSDMAFRVLMSHQETTMIANDMALSKIRKRNPAEYEKTKSRIVHAVPAFGELKTLSAGGLTFEVFGQIHDDRTKEAVTAYLLELGGLKILLHADTTFDQNLESLQQLDLENKGIDLWFFTDRPHATLDKVMKTMIKPKAYVIMHNPINDARKYEATVKVYPNAIGFVGSMEKKVFIKR